MQPDPPSSGPSSGEPAVSSDPSSLHDQMVEAFGGWSVIRPRAGAPATAPHGETATEAVPAPVLEESAEAPAIDLPHLAAGTVLLDRYLLGRPVGRAELRLFCADDRATRRPVTVQLLPAGGVGEPLMARLRLARSIAHRCILRVHDVAATPWGALVVMEAQSASTLADAIEAQRDRGGMSVDEIRRIGGGIAAALSAIHEQGLVHGRVEPSMILLADGAPRLLASLLTSAEAPFSADAMIAEDRSAFHSPERARGGGPSLADDLFGLGMTLWALSTKVAPAVGVDPRSSSLRSDALHAEITRLTPDELRQMFGALSPNPAERPQARTYRFFDSRQSSPTLLQRQTDRLYPGPPATVGDGDRFPATMSLLMTFAATAPELVGELFPLRKPIVSLGRDELVDVSLADRTVSAEHATLVWRKGAWIITDRRSTNGTYTDASYERQTDARLRHGGEIQFGELRVRLVSFAAGSPEHRAARAFLARRDGLTGLLAAPHLFDAIRAEQGFADWADLPMHLAVFEVRQKNPARGERLTVPELLVLRRTARRVTELTDALLLNLRTATAGVVPSPPGPLGEAVAPRVVVAWIGVSAVQARTLLDTMLAELRAMMPPGLVLRAALAALPSGSDPAVVVERAPTHS